MLGACSGPYRRRFVRVRGLSRAFRGLILGFLRVCGRYSPTGLSAARDRASGNRIIVRILAGNLEVAGGLGGPGRALGA